MQAERRTAFDRLGEPHMIIVARGDRIRHFTVRPWLLALAGTAIALVAVAYLLATSYLVFRDGLIQMATTRQAHMQQAYEERIATLRTQLDRVTSRQLLDQQLMEKKVSRLLERQAQLTRRHGRISPLIERSDAMTTSTAAIPTPTPRPDAQANLTNRNAHIEPPGESANAYTGSIRPDVPWPISKLATDPTGDRAKRLFKSISRSLRTIESQQIDRVRALTESAYRTADTITDALEGVGLDVASGNDDDAMGGPLRPISAAAGFDTHVHELDDALDRLEAVMARAQRLPIRNPVPGARLSSGFGPREDPISHAPAFHSGMDFGAAYGSPAHAAASGTVTRAGWAGGYGRMVEIDHGDGFVTRYGHLSKLLVHKGETVTTGQVIGKVGSSGRSTGPHLHYEVRREDRAVNPARLLNAGRKIAKLL